METYLSYAIDYDNNTYDHKLWVGVEPHAKHNFWRAYISNLSELGIKAAIAENCEIVTGVEITGVEFDCDGDKDLAQSLECRAIGKKYINVCPDQIADMLSDDFGYCVIGCSWEFA
jgi:hypothetical protein